MKTDEIREWIISVKGTEPSPFQLNRVLDNSAGIPIVLEEWINQPGDLDYNTITH